MEAPRIPGYEIRSTIGRGGFATVYRAVHLALERDVALKVMSPALSADASFRERFFKEGRDTAALGNHPNIVTIYDVGRAGDYHYIAMQYLPGPNLQELLRSDEPYPHPLYIVRRIAGALAYAHQRGIVHRDVKPANILFNEAGEAVLSDFGIARDRNATTSLTTAGSMIGTIAYMSPEQIRGAAGIDGRSDLYSLGVVLHELLTRYKPFRADETTAMMLMHLEQPIPRLPPAEARYQPLLDRLMAKAPEDRYADADALIDDLETNYLDDRPSVVAAPATAAPARRWLAGIAALGAVALIAAGATTWLTPWPDNRSGDRQDLTPERPDVGLVPPSEEDWQRLEQLLEVAGLHEEVGRIHDPPGANAIEAYSLALEIDPDNATAKAALARLGVR